LKNFFFQELDLGYRWALPQRVPIARPLILKR